MNKEELEKEIHLDSIVNSVIEKYRHRALKGKQKYGTDMDRDDLNIVQWLTHAQEEAMDLSIYLEKLIKKIDKYE